MLRRLRAEGFKSLANCEIHFPQLTVLFGPNAAGKSNLVEAVQAVSRIGTSRTLTDALASPIRGYPFESFAFPPDGLPGLLSQESSNFSVEADIECAAGNLRYRVGISLHPGSGSLSVTDEYLCELTLKSELKGIPVLEPSEGQLVIRRRRRGRPLSEPLGMNHSVLSDPRFSGDDYEALDECRKELSGWRTYYLDPRVAMRRATPPAIVQDIGTLGEDIAPLLFRLKAEKPKHYEAVRRTLRTLIPSVEDLSVDLDKQRGTLDILVRQAGCAYSSRIISEGTLRVLALCAISANPWSGSVLAFEEPENGVHPRRLELIADLIASMTTATTRQVIVTTHSPIFCEAVLRKAAAQPDSVSLFLTRRGISGTEIERFTATGPLMQDSEIANALSNRSEDGIFEGLMQRGLLDD